MPKVCLSLGFGLRPRSNTSSWLTLGAGAGCFVGGCLWGGRLGVALVVWACAYLTVLRVRLGLLIRRRALKPPARKYRYLTLYM